MPLHGKIVVIKRSGVDGTEFPLTASCLFGRKPDCDIRIQLPQVSKEHCRIDLNENKEVMLTNLSSVNPTCINGAVMNQAKHLKHGDVITIIDRSFRFEYPPEPTPKKRRPSASGKSETLQVLQYQQVIDPGVLVTEERRKSSELTSDSCLKDGTNTSNVQACAVQDCEDAAKEAIASVLEQSKPSDKESLSPFCELYQMIKQNMQSSQKPSEAAQPKTPLSRCEAAKTMETKVRVAEMDGEEPTSQDAHHTPLPKNVTEQKRKSSVGCEENKQAEGGFVGKATPKSAKRRSKLHTQKTPADGNCESVLTVSGVSTLPTEGQVEDSSQPLATPSKGTPKKNRRSLQSPAKQSEKPSVLEEMTTPTSQKKPRQATPRRFSAGEVVRQIVSENVAEETCQSAEKSETPKGRRSKESGSTVLPCPISDSVTPGRRNGFQSPDISVLNLKQTQTEEEAEISKEIPAEKSPKTKEAASTQVSPRKSPRKNLKAPDVLPKLELAAPPSGKKAVIAGNPPPSGKKRKSGQLESDLPTPRLKRKRVSFGTQLSPELFDRRLPPDSPLRKGATPGRRGPSFLKRAVLAGASTIGLLEEMGAEVGSPKSKSQRSPGKKASPKSMPSVNGGPSSAKKSPKLKTQSPEKPKARGSPGPKSPALAKTPSPARPQSPCTREPMTPKGKRSLTPCTKAPSAGRTPAKVESSGTPRGKKSPLASAKTPPSAPADTGRPSPAISARDRRRSVSDALKTPSPVQSTAEASMTPLPVPTASRPAAKTPSPRGMSFKDDSSNGTPTVRGRFSVSRISTPSPVADQDAGAAGMSECVTPCVPLRRKSMKKTPKSARKSVLEVIRSRRSGASRANLKVVSSWADIVKFGVSKPQTGVPTKNRTAKAATVKKAVVKKPKTPAKKVQEHFSTGHAASPATIVVGKAHAKVPRAAGSAPKLVHNIALLGKNTKVNEDLTGIAEMFCTPVNVREKKIRTRGSVCPETPQAATSSFTEDSVICTPEETGEMVVSPLSVASPAKRGTYNSEAVTRLLQEDQDSSLIGVDAPQGSVDALTASVIPAEHEEKQDPVLKRIRTPKPKPEPLTCLTGDKRLTKTPKQKAQQVVDLRGIKRLLKTPKEPKVSQEASLVGVKEMLKTPKPPKGQPVEDLVGVQRMMKTPMLKKVEPVEHFTGVKRLMKTPMEKGQPVVDKFGLRRLMQTPKQKLEHVEDLTGVKQLMQTPKQKGKPVENKFGLRRLMKSPRQRGGAAVEDFAGLKELMEEPSDYLLPEVGINKEHETSEEKISETSVFPEVGKNLAVPAETGTASREDPTELNHEENQSNASKKSVRGRPQKQVEKRLVAESKDGDSEGVEIKADAAEQNLPDVKSKRGRKACAVAPTPVKRTRQKIPEIKEEAVSSAVAAPTKPTRGKRARNVEEVEKATVKDEPCETVESAKQRDDEVKSADVEAASVAEPAALVQAPANGRRGKRTEDAPPKVPTPAPVRKVGRSRKAKATESTASDESVKVECVETPPTPQKAEDAPEKISSPVPVVKPKRGRKQKQLDDGHVTAAQAAESDVSEAAQCDIESRVPETEEQAPVRSGRGRKTKAVAKEDQPSLEVPAKRTRRGAIDLVVQTAAPSPVPAIKSGRARGRKAQNLDSTEKEAPIQAEALSTECSTETPRKTRGKGRPPKISESVTDKVALPAPVHSEGGDCMPEDSQPNDLEKNVRGRTSRRGKIVSQKAGVDEADKKEELKTSDVKAVKKTLSKKAVWNSHLVMPQTSESRELASSVEGSPQRKLKKSEEPTAGLAESAGNSGVETEANLEEQTKSRRGRAGKKSTIQPTESSLDTKSHDPEPCTGKAPSTRKGRTSATKTKPDPAKQDTPVPKRGMKRKPTPENVDEVTGDNEPASESVEPDPQPKRARSRAAKAEETKSEATTLSKMKRGVAKKTGKALQNPVEETGPEPEEPKQVETPKPAGRGRRKPVQQAGIKPEPMRASPTKGEMKTAKTDAKTTTRGRVKTQKKADSPSSAEPKPVRRTRRK